MGIFGKRRRKVLTPLVLALWLFAIFVGVAHACGLGERFEHVGAVGMVTTSGPDSPDENGSPNCEKFCAEDLPIPAKLKAFHDLPDGQFLLASPSVGGSFQATKVASLPRLAARDPPPALAIYTRFVRLAL
jgi:hypothetical protein